MHFSHEKNVEHATNPKVGDYWQEMFSPVAVVIAVTPIYVITIEKQTWVDSDHWTWDLESEPCIYTRKSFKYRFTYGRTNDPAFAGHIDVNHINNKYWCDVRPEQHKWIEEEWAQCSTVK